MTKERRGMPPSSDMPLEAIMEAISSVEMEFGSGISRSTHWRASFWVRCSRSNMFLQIVVRFAFSTFSMSCNLSSSGRTASAGSRRCRRSLRWVCFLIFFWTERGPRRKPGTGGRTLKGKQA